METTKTSLTTRETRWCPNGCQDLCGLGECGMCGYVGKGVLPDETVFVIVEDEDSTGRYKRIPRSKLDRGG